MSRDYRTNFSYGPVVEGAAIAGGLLLAQHIGLYRWRGILPMPVRYGLGVSAALAGFAHVCAEKDTMGSWLDMFLIFAVGGLIVGGGHTARWLKFRREERRASVPDYARIGGA